MSNPIIKGYYADPDVMYYGGKYYIYPTTDGGVEWNGSYFKAFSSTDLKEWKDEGIILDLKNVPWSGGTRAWAPCICEKNGKFYFYYSGNTNIGVAIGDSPTGPFIDKGAPLVDKDDFYGQMIDPDVFIDDDGQAYLYWGNSRMYVAKLAEDMISFASDVMEITPECFTEGSCIFKRNGIYYYTWCKGDTRAPDYNVRYGTGTSPMQKPEGNTVILIRDFAVDRRVKATAHHTILNIPGTDEWYIIYHRFNVENYGHIEEKNTEAGNHREICMDRLFFDDDGNIIPIKPTL